MAKQTSAVPAIVKKALAESNKSAGMRMLFEAGKTVAEVKAIFNAPYGFAYGVALRGGFAATAANRRAPRKVAAPKAKARAAKVVKSTTKPAPRAKATTAKRVVAARPNLSKAARTRVASAR